MQKIKGKGYWKLNNDLINNELFKREIINCILWVDNQYSYMQSKKIFWEILKSKIKKTAISFSVRQAKAQSREKVNLQNEIDNLSKYLERCDKEDTIRLIQNKINDNIKKLDKIYDREVKGNFIRSRSQYLEEGEKSSRYFLNLEKKRQSENVIRKLKTNKGTHYKDVDILRETCNFYKELYKDDNIKSEDINEYLNDMNIENRLNEKDKLFFENEITKEEVLNAVKQLKNNKSPALDGLTPEFYKHFWHELEPFFMDMIVEVYETGQLTESQKTAVLSLIFKKGERDNLAHYRPLSLTNYDYKIIAHVIANRIQKVIHKLVNKDQSAYVKNRFIGNNARMFIDLIDFADNNNIEGILLCLDFKKAFDSLSWDFMLNTLKRLNFGTNFLKWIKIMYTEPKIRIKNNGHLSEEITLYKGIRQGCPASALLFIICTEVLANQVINNNAIRGINIGDREIKIVQHADDTTLALSNKESISETIKTVELFSSVSGLKLNIEKTEGIWLGQYKGSGVKYGNINFKDEPVKCLGVYIGNNKKDCETKNWDNKIRNFEKLFESWKKRKLTLIGKSVIINMLGISKFIYNFTVLETPEYVIQTINTIIFKFLWKIDRLKRSHVIGKHMDGGLNIVDVKSKIDALKATWVKRLVGCETSWTIIPSFILRDIGFDIKDFLKTKFDDNVSILNDYPFYKSVFVAYNKCKTCKVKKKYGNEIIWLNEEYKWKKKVLYYKNWIEAGYMYTKDLYNRDGSFIDERVVLQKLGGNTRNWISEYMTIRSAVNSKVTWGERELFKYTNIKYDTTFNLKSGVYTFKTVTSKTFYEILVGEKFERNKMEKKWIELYNVPNSKKYFSSVYESSVKNMSCKRLAEFNYKLLHNILSCGYVVNKWNMNVNKYCETCNEIQTAEHLLFDCKIIKPIWEKTGNILKCKITWKNLLLGYSFGNMETETRRLILTIILKCIHSIWSKNSENHYAFKTAFFNSKIASSIKIYSEILNETNQNYNTYVRKLNSFVENFL